MYAETDVLIFSSTTPSQHIFLCYCNKLLYISVQVALKRQQAAEDAIALGLRAMDVPSVQDLTEKTPEIPSDDGESNDRNVTITTTGTYLVIN